MQRRLIFADGTTLEKGEAGYADGFLWLYMKEITLQEAAGIAFDQAKTQRIIFDYDVQQDTYEGFTTCIDLHTDRDGQVSVCLKKAVE